MASAMAIASVQAMDTTTQLGRKKALRCSQMAEMRGAMMDCLKESLTVRSPWSEPRKAALMSMEKETQSVQCLLKVEKSA